MNTNNPLIFNILDGCKRNNRSSQRELYEWLKDYAVHVCYRYTNNYHDVEELVSEGFVKVFKNIHLFDGAVYGLNEASFKGWFKKVLVNNCIDWIRKKHLPTTHYPDLEVVERADKSESVEDKMSYKEIIEAVRELSPMYRIVFNLFVIEGMTHEEISAQLGIGVGTSKSNLFKARESLKKILQKKTITKYA